jgi:branched-chain amino acid transport system substrate-binding protein
VAYARAVLGAERVALVHETQTYGAFLAEVMREAAGEVGLELAGTWPFDPAAADLGKRLDGIAAALTRPGGPAFVLLAMQPEAGAALIERLHARGFAGRLVGTDALASQVFVDGLAHLPEERARRGALTDGIFVSTPFLFDSAGREGNGFLRDYVAAYASQPDWYAALSADAARVLVEALRRSELSLTPEKLAEDRAALRDALKRVDVYEPVQGVTGPIFFDAVGDPTRAVAMGRFAGGEVVSAFVQLRPLPEGADHAALARDRVVTLSDRRFVRTDLARVGVRVRRFGDIDFDAGRFEAEFDLWFRDAGSPGVEDIEFVNAVEPVSLGAPEQEVVKDGVSYRRYRVKGVFQTDAIEPPYGGHTLALVFRPRARTREDLILAIDTLGMNVGRGSATLDRNAPIHKLLAARDWRVTDLVFFEEEADEPALGHPVYMERGEIVLRFSRLALGVTLLPNAVGLRGMVPPRWQPGLLAFALAGSVALLFLGRGSGSKPRFLAQAALALLLLTTAEPVIGRSAREVVAPVRLNQLSRGFSILWWLLPALLANVAIDRFVWRPAELRSGNPIPTLLRWFVASLIFLFAVFGIVAFVYNYKLTGLLATSGVVAMILGLAVQLNITNLFAGVALNLERPFRVGDWIMVHGRTPDPQSSVIGMVVDINWRTTRLRTADDTEIVIPNGVISEKTITNFMHPGELSRFELDFTIDQTVPPERVLPVIRGAVDAVLGVEREGPVAEPAPSVRIARVEGGAITYRVRYRIVPREVSPARARHTINESVLRSLREAGIELAVPRRRIVETKEQPLA